MGSGEGLLRTGGGLSQSSQESSIGSSLMGICREGMVPTPTPTPAPGPPEEAEEAWAADCRAGMGTEELWEAAASEKDGALEESSGWWCLCGRNEVW